MIASWPTAVSKSKSLADCPATGSSLVAVLSAFVAARNRPDGSPWRLCVALSGGRDSVVLLHALSRLECLQTPAPALTLSAVHVHHGISPMADDWAVFCEEFCRRLDVPLCSVRVQVPRTSGEGLEAAARRLRYAVFASCQADALALAHHRDDQAETVLLNLLRGAGLAGAAGMPYARAQPSGPEIVRPLLGLPRAALAAYAVTHGLAWIDDESNDDRHFRRNFLRHEIFPLLEEKFPGACQSLARAASHFTEGAALLDELACIDQRAVTSARGRVSLAALISLPEARQRNVLRRLWRENGLRAPDTRWIDEALRQLQSADAQSAICLSTAEGALHVYRGELYLVRPFLLPAAPVPWSGQPCLSWAGGQIRFVPVTGQGISRQCLDSGEVLLKCRQGGERFLHQENRPCRSLRKTLQEAAIPPWERTRLPLLWQGERLLWVGGLGVAADCVCPPGEEGILPLWDADGHDFR